MKHNQIKKTAVALAILASVGSPLSYAEEIKEEAKEVEVISVTGSRIARTDIEGIAPLVVFTRADLDASAMTNVGQFLQKMPSISGPAANHAQQFSGGVATATLRGLGSRNTLVLVNGRRLGSAGVGGYSDLNSIPMAAVENIEVLLDGASAVYGSDAIAGVVNVIMNTDFEGMKVKTNYGISDRNDNAEKGLEITYGIATDKGNLLVSYSRTRVDGYRMASRNVQADPDKRGMGGVNLRDPLSSTGSTYNIDGDWYVLKDSSDRFNSMDDLREYNHPWDESWFPGDVPVGDEDGFNYWLYDMGSADLDVENWWVSGTSEVNNDVEIFFEYLQNDRKSLSQSQPYAFTSDFGDPVTYSADNMYNTTGQSFNVARAFMELGARDVNNIDASTTRMVVGAKGEFHDWDWDLSFNRQRTESYNNIMGVSYSRVLAAAGSSAECEARSDGCVPLDLMGKVGSITPEMLTYLQRDAKSRSEGSMDSYQFNITGDLFETDAGVIKAAFGAEYRSEHAIYDASKMDEDGDRIFQGGLADTNPPEVNITEFYGEVVIPLLSDVSMAKLLEVDMSARYSDYSDFGTTTTPKFGLKWQPIEGVLVRGSYSEGFRAPGFDELHSGLVGGWGNAPTDPCANQDDYDYTTLPGCPQNLGGPAPIGNGAFTYSGGNSELEPEKSESITAGIVWVPSFLDGFTISVDMFDIEKTNVIRTSNRFETILNNAEGKAGFENMVDRAADGHISNVYVLYENTGYQNITGFDTEITYAFSTDSFGAFDFNIQAAKMTDYKSGDSEAVAKDFVGNWYEGSSFPKLKVNMTATWNYDNLGLTWTTRYVDGVTAAPGQGYWYTESQKVMDSSVKHDAQLSYDIVDLDSNISIGVENVFDAEPPLVIGSYRNGYDATNFTSRGRYFYARVSMSF